MRWFGNGWGWSSQRGGFYRRRPLDPLTTFIVLVVALSWGAIERTLMQIDVERVVRWSILGAVGAVSLGIGVWLFRRHQADRAAQAAEDATNPTADVVALRFAVEPNASAKLMRDLAVAVRRPIAERLAAVSQRLLEAQLDWRFVALETTKPLPEHAASELFFFWSDGVRQRYTPPAGSDTAGLVVVCLHVETSEEIPDLDTKDPKSAASTLENLRDQSRTVRRVDVWASRRPIAQAALVDLDPHLIPARG